MHICTLSNGMTNYKPIGILQNMFRSDTRSKFSHIFPKTNKFHANTACSLQKSVSKTFRSAAVSVASKFLLQSTPSRLSVLTQASRCFHTPRKYLLVGMTTPVKNCFSRALSTTAATHAYRGFPNVMAYQKRTYLYYLGSLIMLVGGASYAAVPLYRMFCQAYSYGGAVQIGDTGRLEALQPIPERKIKIQFQADTAASMTWNFRPQQNEIELVPGETALAFYRATNPLDRPVIGVSTYNVLPFEAGQYFNKIQCFCFEEQMLGPGEVVDMPVFFYIDSEFDDDPNMDTVQTITLSYTFFEAMPGVEIPLPGFMRRN